MDIDIIYQMRKDFYICMVLLYMLGMTFDLQFVIGGVQWHGDQNSCSTLLSLKTSLQVYFSLNLALIC